MTIKIYFAITKINKNYNGNNSLKHFKGTRTQCFGGCAIVKSYFGNLI